jgi:uncharacterized protein (DUF1800 family)
VSIELERHSVGELIDGTKNGLTRVAQRRGKAEVDFTMANTTDLDAVLALSRFGLGATESGAAPILPDPRGALREEIIERFVPTPVGSELRPSADLLAALFDFQDQRKAQMASQAALAPPSDGSAEKALAAGQVSAAGRAAAIAGKTKPGAFSTGLPATIPPRPPPYLPQQVFLAELDARFNGTIHEPPIGIGERLTMFWANHFAVSAAKQEEVRILAGAFEREAIRPHVFGRFADMLLAVETHPAMLFYLDNQQSVGPDSKAGARGKRGLNENLARETMELHTLGVGGGYTQIDVTSLAAILTGWTVQRRPSSIGAAGIFAFNPGAHQPGEQTLLGLTYADDGFVQGREALKDLARQSATARHIATKLAQHFVADEPPPELVRRLAATFTKTDGDLQAVTLELISCEVAWTPTSTKVRSPMEYVVALLRASGEKPKPQFILGALNAMGQPLWAPAQPNGYPDTAAAWISSEGLSTRIDVASLIARNASPQIDPRRISVDLLGPLLSPETSQAISRAETKAQGLSIAFLSPEFQRR